MSVAADAEILREMQAHMYSILRIHFCLDSEVLDRLSLAETQSHRYRVLMFVDVETQHEGLDE